ncbi:amino-acid permease [Fusarium sp. NRRL 52700]|nr:amino-acid permease [Fusarium sp. NRRL 52700]
MANIINALTSIARSAFISSVSSACFVIRLSVAQNTQTIPTTSAVTVFGDYTNYSDWEMLVSALFTFFYAAKVITGWNAPSAVAEETDNARIVAPRSIINTLPTSRHGYFHLVGSLSYRRGCSGI